MPKIGAVCQNACKKVFIGMFFFLFFGGYVFCCLCFLFLCFVKKAQKGYFPASFLSILFPQRACFKMLLLFLFCFFFVVFPFSSLSKFHFFLCFFVHQPLFGKDFFGGFLLSFYFVFSFLNVCFFVWNNFLTSPFWTPSCFCFWHFFCCFCFVFMVYVFAFLFWCWFCFVMFLFCFDFVFFCLVSCFLLSDYEKHCFPAILVFFVVLALK